MAPSAAAKPDVARRRECCSYIYLRLQHNSFPARASRARGSSMAPFLVGERHRWSEASASKPIPAGNAWTQGTSKTTNQFALRFRQRASKSQLEARVFAPGSIPGKSNASEVDSRAYLTT